VRGHLRRDQVGRLQFFLPDARAEKIDRVLDALPQVEGPLFQVELARLD
jgi:hypothetical protein